MATMVEGGADLFDALAFGMPQPGVYDFLAQRAQQYSSSLTHTGSEFVQNIKSYYNAVNESEAARIAREAMRKVGSIWNTDIIRPLVEIHDFQNAGLQMQRWVMAEPTTRQMYIAQQCEGYSESYIDVEPGRVGAMHYDYRRATEGLVLETDDGWYATTYIEDLREGDRTLTLDEKGDIQTAWDSLRAHIKERKGDPTSRFGGKL